LLLCCCLCEMRLCLGLHNTFNLQSEEKPPLLLFGEFFLNFWWEEVHDIDGIASILGGKVRQMTLCLRLHTLHLQSAMWGEATPSLVHLILDLWAQCVGCLNFGEVRCWGCLNFWWEKADLVRYWKKHQQSNPHIGTGTPRIGLGRDLSIFQIGESQKRYGVHSNLGTNICNVILVGGQIQAIALALCDGICSQNIRCEAMPQERMTSWTASKKAPWLSIVRVPRSDDGGPWLPAFATLRAYILSKHQADNNSIACPIVMVRLSGPFPPYRVRILFLSVCGFVLSTLIPGGLHHQTLIATYLQVANYLFYPTF
jgi:hypothetical protein